MKTVRLLIKEAGGDESLADMLENMDKLNAAVREYNEAAMIQIPSGVGVQTFNDITVETNQASLMARHELAGRHLKLVVLLLDRVRARWNRLTLKDEGVLKAVFSQMEKQKQAVPMIGLADRTSHQWDMTETDGMVFGVTRCKKCGVVATQSTDLSYCTEP